METLKISPSASANEAVLVANTPSFIFKRLREDPIVRQIADALKPAQIADWLRARGGKPENPEDLVLRYMYLVAFSMKDPKEVTALMGDLPLNSVEWGKQIVELGLAKARASTQIIWSMPQSKSMATVATSASHGIFIPDTKSFHVRKIQ
jgi:hypothetical protein